MVYCLEEIDNGENLSSIVLSSDIELKASYEENLLGEIVTIKGKAFRTDNSDWGNQLYNSNLRKETPIEITAIPYCMWGNRTPGEMLCWVRMK